VTDAKSPAAASPLTASPHILMCPPEFYGIEYEINPWMSRRRQADHELAVRQWEELYKVIPGPRSKGLVHDARQGSARSGVYGQCRADPTGNVRCVSLSATAAAAGEATDRQWFAEHGFQVRPLKSDTYLEGAGDALFCGDTLLQAIASAATSVAIRSWAN